MDQETPKRRFRLILDFKCQFPEKLYDVANDGYLIKWTRNGAVSVTSENEFEANVMKLYPGFLQIPSFQNLKRLFREYGFDRTVNQNHEYEWSHPMFIRGRRELVYDIKTRRKSFRISHDSRDFDDGNLIIPSENRRFSVRKRRTVNHYNPPSKHVLQRRSDVGGGGDVLTNSTLAVHINTPLKAYVIRSPFPNSVTAKTACVENQWYTTAVDEEAILKSDSNDKVIHLNELEKTFAENEFNETEYQAWLEKQKQMDESKNDESSVSEEKSKVYWWMYDNKDSVNIIQNADILKQTTSIDQESFMPCGFCKCCSAISNYVHLFGEIPENIQVIDYPEEVVQSQPVEMLDIQEEVVQTQSTGKHVVHQLNDVGIYD